MSAPFSFGSNTWPGCAKLVEEAGEVTQVIGKLMMTGGRVAHWDGSDLKERLEDEIADLMAAVTFVRQYNNLNGLRITERTHAKMDLFRKWRAEQSEDVGATTPSLDGEALATELYSSNSNGGEGNG